MDLAGRARRTVPVPCCLVAPWSVSTRAPVMTPRFSVITPVYNTNRKHLEECISSVLAQTFENWELCLVDDHSSKPQVRKILEAAASLDPRIRPIFREKNGGIVDASNDGLSMARGEFVVLLDHDDVIEPDALMLINELIDSDPLIDYVYTDETLITDGGQVVERFHKPDWSPERFRHQMYVCHLSVIRRSLVLEVGGFRPGYDGSQDYDLMLRVAEKARKIAHIPKLLYHWRMASTSVANNASAKPYAYDAGKRAIEAHLERSCVSGQVSQVPGFPGNYRLDRHVEQPISIEVFVPDTGRVGDVWGLERNHLSATLRDLEEFAGSKVKLTAVGSQASLSSCYNSFALDSRADVVVFASESLEPIQENWAKQLTEPMAQHDIGIVSGFTYTANSRLEHAGYVLHGSFLERSHYRMWRRNRGQRAILETIHEVAAVDWQCMAVRRDLFESLGGFDESLDHPWVTVDFCLRALERGFSTVVTPRAEFFEYSNNDNYARGRQRAPKRFREKWIQYFESDPYRPKPPLRQSVEARRPFWRPQHLRDFTD